MASGANPRRGSGPKRTGGIVSHVAERFGFLELTNKNIPITKVYFDFTSFESTGSEKDLSKIFPKGTNVSFTFVESKGDHKVKHRAVNLVKAQPSRQNSRDKHQEAERSRGSKQDKSHKFQHGQAHPHQKQGKHGGGVYPHEPGAGSSYPHQSYEPPKEDNSFGRLLRETIATGLTHMAEKLTDNDSRNVAPQPVHKLGQAPRSENAGKREHGNHGNKQKKRRPQGKPQAKAFNDKNASGELKAPLQCSEDSTVSEQHNVEAFVTHGPAEVLVEQAKVGDSTEHKKKSRPKKNKLFNDPEAKIFQNLLAKEWGEALKNKLTSLGLKSLNDLVLLRLTIGKQPSIRVYANNETANHSLDETKAVDLEELERMKRHDDVVKMSTPHHYGVKGSLHSIRTIEQNGKLSGITLLCQFHEERDRSGLEIVEGKSVTAVVGDVRIRPLKYIYSFIRCKSKEAAKTKDVLVLDVDGQLSGCDQSPHPSLGDVTRISCSSSTELPIKISESIEHLHECVVAIGVDSKETLQALQKMTTKGAELIVEISPDLKSDFESLFS